MVTHLSVMSILLPSNTCCCLWTKLMLLALLVGLTRGPRDLKALDASWMWVSHVLRSLLELAWRYTITINNFASL